MSRTADRSESEGVNKQPDRTEPESPRATRGPVGEPASPRATRGRAAGTGDPVRPAGSSRWLGQVAVVVTMLAVAWAWWLERPPAPLPLDAPPERFSAARAMQHLDTVAARQHMSGSAEHRRVREYLVAQLEELGFEVQVQQTTVLGRPGRVIRAVTVRNIVARRRGAASTGGVALVAHYDSQQLPPGAGDDGSGVVAILEAVRALQQFNPLRNDLYVLITDAEELGLMGARGFVDEHPWWDEIEVLLNFEARGAAGQAVMFETNVDNGWVVREFARADPYPTGSSLYYEIYQRLPNDTDFSVFKRAGVTGLNFAMAEGADRYHRTTDTVANLSAATVQHHGEHALSLARHFGGLDLSGPTTAPDIVFFRAGPLGLITYSAEWAFPLAVLAALFVVALIIRGGKAGRVGFGGFCAGFALAVAAIAAAAGASWLLWLIVRGAHHELGSIVGRALYNEAWYGLAIAALCTGIVAELFSLGGRRFSTPSLALGSLALPLGLSLLSGWYVPGVSMLFLWPAVFAALAVAYALAGSADRSWSWIDLAVVTLLSLPIVALLFPLVWGLYIGLNISTAPAIAGVIVLLLVLLVPTFDMAQQRNGWWLPASAFGLAVVFAGVGVVDARPGRRRPIPSDLVYAIDRESGDALWATMQAGDDGWIERFVSSDAEPGDLAAFLAGNNRAYRASPAPPIDAPRAQTRVVFDITEAGVRRLRLEVVPAVGPELVNVSPAAGADVELMAVNDVMAPNGAATGRGDWLLQHFGEAPGGVLTLDLRTAQPGTPLELLLVEFQMRLPSIAGMETGRPPGWVAHGGRLTDVTLFRQVMRIEGAPANR